MMQRREFVDALARENRESYGTSDGRASLRVFELTFEHSWTYVFELVQNALDAHARAIAFRLSEDGDSVIFQHDGDAPIEEPEVEGISKIFRSTKGAASVGFMGIGFKSVFGRFREAQISGWGWTFRFEITQSVGNEYGDVQTDLLGAVMPIWDPGIECPEDGFTTRFELRMRRDRSVGLSADLSRFVSNHDLTPLAILAASRLQRLDVDGSVWDLSVDSVDDGTMTAIARADGAVHRWRLFSVEYQPSRRAIRRFLEYRRIQPKEDEREKVYEQAARKRRVLGILPLDDRWTPIPPERGRIYATLPTEVTLPFRIHVNADWLLNISRMGLGEIENAWQREIVDRIADVLGCLLDWVSRACSEPDTIKAGFAVLASPASEAVGIEAILAEEPWLSRLRDALKDAAVFPVWTERSSAIAFARPDETLVPPTPLADAFEEEPALEPGLLMNGPVLARAVLGSGAAGLLRRIRLLRTMTSGDLERAWAGGLQNWWSQLGAEKGARRDLMFRIWGALSMLNPEGDWSTEKLRCVRTESGQWQSACESAFMNELLPSDAEPGGSEARGFIHQCIPNPDHRVVDAWIRALRGGQQTGAAGEQRYLMAAREWIEKHARSVGLQKVIETAMDDLMASPTPNWEVLVPFGCWVMHRNRNRLLTHVLVDGNGQQRCVPIGDALLADPYVRPDAAGRSRRLLFPGTPTISAKYLDTSPEDTRKWCGFFEGTGAKGALRVRPVGSTTWKENQAAEFLGLEPERIDYSTRGYTLQDFDTRPVLPEPNASSEVRAAIAAWLDDGFSVLRGKGRRQAELFYRRRKRLQGTRPSLWVETLSELVWVPCADGCLRCPGDVLSRPDPARPDVPAAELSDALLEVLEREGVNFGTRVPEVTALQRLMNIGSQLTAGELAKLLHDVRAQISTDEDKRRFKQAVSELLVQSDDGDRIPVGRVVRRVGGRHRGALGGWITPIGRLHHALRDEFEHPNFPLDIPETATGDQALDYILDVWARARSSPDGLANSVREVLPSAYAYCLDDCSDDSALSERWANAVSDAAVFTDREWIAMADANNVYYDDVGDRRFIPVTARVRTVTSGHLANSLSDQRRTANALHLPLLSTSVKIEWFVDEGSRADDWIPRFDVICSLLQWVRGVDAADGDRSETESRRTELQISSKLAVRVSIDSAPPEYVPVNARLHGGVLTVTGRPVQFGADAAKELLRDFSFRQRGDLAANLTGMLMVIDEPRDFDLAVDKFRRSFAPDFDLPIRDSGPATDSDDLSEVDRTSATPVLSSTANKDLERERTEPEDSSVDSIHSPSVPSEDSSIVESAPSDPHTTEAVKPGAASFSRDRALAAQRRRAQELKESLKAEIAPSDDEHEANATEERGPITREPPSDEVYRRVAAQYERECGREPEYGDPYQEGWDLRSIDPATGRKRLIEVKGKGCLWDNDEVVELSRAQVHKAFAMSGGKQIDLWYLYVVERADDGSYSVLPIENPVDVASKWILCGGSWRMIADEPRRITIE